MKKQVIVIGGGTSFDTYVDYISYLKSKEINIDRLKWKNDWKNTLGGKLGGDFEVLVPKMPNVTNARYSEWKIWLERIIALLNKDVILIGHSLGGIFLTKYLSENSFPKKILATFLVAAPFDDANSDESLAEFKLPASLSRLAEQGGSIFLFQSEDDPIVPLEQLGKYKKALPNAKPVIFKDRGHFKQETLPEIVELIKSMF